MASGRSEEVPIALLLFGAIILFAAALPDRKLTLKAAGAEAAITGGALGGTISPEAAAKAAEETIAQASDADVAQALSGLDSSNHVVVSDLS